MQPPNTLSPMYPQQPAPTPQSSNGFLRFLTTKRSMPTWVIALLCLGCLGIGNASGGTQNSSAAPSSASSSQTAPTSNAVSTATVITTPTRTPLPPTSTPQPKPTTIASFSGSTSKNTANFIVKASQWTIKWSCQGGQYGGNFAVGIKSSDGSSLDSLAVNVVCDGNMSDSTIERQAGEFYINVTADVNWQITVVATQ